MTKLVVVLGLFSSFALAKISVVKETHRELQLEVELTQPITHVGKIGDDKYSFIDFPEFDTISEERAPLLPVLRRFIAVPLGKAPKVTVVPVKQKKLKLPHPIAYNSGTRRHCQPANKPLPVSQPLLEGAKNLPLASVTKPHYAGPVYLSTLAIRPVTLVTEKELLVTTSLKITVNFKPSASHPPVIHSGRLSLEGYRIFSSLTLNRPIGVKVNQRKAPVDLIIAHREYEDSVSLAKLIRFKWGNGRDVRLKFIDTPTKTHLKDLIGSEYKAAAPPTHTLIVGSIDQIPSHRRSSYWSDYPYSLLDSGNAPDISIARFPVRNAAELDQMVEKVIDRETAPRTDENILVTSGYETGWCHKNLEFIRSKIFAKSRNPLNETRMYATEGKKTDAVVGGYNANPNYIIYDGHGNATGMTEIPLKISHLSRLKNTVYPIIFDIACLNSYWPSSGASANNFAHSIATLKKAGAAGILAASSNSNGHDLFRHMFRAFIYDENNTTEHFHNINEVGSVVLYGKLKYYEQHGSSAVGDNHMFYFHGDPASTLNSRP